MSWWSRIKNTFTTWIGGEQTEKEQKSPLNEKARALAQSRLNKISRQHAKLIKSRQQDQQNSKNNAQLWYIANKQMEERARLGAHGAGYLDQPLDIISINAALKSVLSDEKAQIEKKIKKLIKKPIGNRSIYFLEEQNVLNVLSDTDGLKYRQWLKRRGEIIAELEVVKKYQNKNTEWKKWYDGKIPSENVKEQLIQFTIGTALAHTDKIPVVGGYLSSALSLYGRFKLSITEVMRASSNLFSHTRRKLAIGQIAGVIGGSIIGAVIMGGALSLVGSVIPGVGSAAGGVTGIVLGAITGAQKGGPIGLKIFQYFSRFSKTLQDESNYQMDYVHLDRLKKVYGFDHDKILRMYSYLNNQIKLVGLDTEEGLLLNSLKINALEEGRQNALAKLCVYFLGQEKNLRTELYQIGALSVNYQKQKNDLLTERRLLHKARTHLDDTQKKRDAEIAQDPFFIKLKALKKRNHITYTDKYLFEYFSSTPIKHLTVQAIQTHFGLRAKEADNLIQLMKRDSPDFDKKYSLLDDGPEKAWLKKWNKNDKALAKNEANFLHIQNKRYEMESDRDNIVALLGEYQRPSHFVQGEKNIWVYGEMARDGDPIGKLFEPLKNDKGKPYKNKKDSQTAEIRRPKNIRSFGPEGYVVHAMASHEKNKALFRETMRADAFKNAKAEAKQRGESFWKKGFEESNKNLLRKHVVKNNEQLNALEILFERIDAMGPLFTKMVSSDEKEAAYLNNVCKQIIFDLQKAGQNFPELAELIKPKLNAIQDIQFYLEYAAISQVYIRRDLAQVQESPLLDLFPYTEHGMVEHLVKEDGTLIDKGVRDKVLSQMESATLPSSIIARFDRFANNDAYTPEKFKEAWQKTGQLACKPEFDLVLQGLNEIKKLQETYKRLKKGDGYLEPKFLYGIMSQANELSHRLNINLENLSRRALKNEEMWGAARKDGIVHYLDLIRECQSQNAVAEMFRTSFGHTDLQQFKLAAALFREKPNLDPSLATSREEPEAMVASKVREDDGFTGLFEQQNKSGRLSNNRAAMPLVGFTIKPATLSFDAVIQEAKAFPSFESITQLGDRFEVTFENIIPKLVIQRFENGSIEILMEAPNSKIMDKVMEILKAQINGYANCVKKDDRLPKEITVLAGKNQEYAELVYFHSKGAGLNPELQSEQLGKQAIMEIKKNYASLVASERNTPIRVSPLRAKQKGK